MSTIVQLISAAHTLLIPETTGNELIAKDSVFIDIDQKLKNGTGLVRTKPTKEIEVGVFEIITRTPLIEAILSIAKSPREACFTQAQIIQFVKKYREWLSVGGIATYLPILINNKETVATITIGGSWFTRISCVKSEIIIEHTAVHPRLVLPV